MNKLKFISYLFIGCLLIVLSCDYDNYDAPSVGVTGSITDATTGELFQSEQPNGYRIRLLEEGYENPVPIDFWGRPDGTFEHSKLFSARYEIIPVEGAFFPVEAMEVDVQQTGTEVSFTVTPFLAISATAELISGNRVVLNYTISQDITGDKIILTQALASKIPTVNNTVFDHRITRDISVLDDEEILQTQFSDTLQGLESSQTYYIRAAARTDNFLGRYNYSQIFEVEIP